jgi:hypothetical protein
MTMKRRSIILGAAAPLVIGAIVLNAHARRPSSGSIPATASEMARTPGLEHKWGLRFELGLTQPGRAESLDVTLTGEWVATITDARADEYDVAYEARGAHLSGGGVHPEDGDVTAAEKRLARPFWITYRADGMAIGAHFPQDMPADARNLLEMIATESELVRGPAGAPEWTATERDGAGLYFAAYARDGDRITKRKLKYIAADGAAGTRAGIEVALDESQAAITLDQGNEIAAFDGGERMRLGTSTAQEGWLGVRVHLQLSGAQTGAAPGRVGELARVAATLDSSPIRTQTIDPAVAQAESDRRLLAGVTEAALLDAATAENPDRGVAPRLAALFRQHPTSIGLAVARVRGHANELVTDALASAGTDGAFDALGGLARDASLPAAVRLDALTAFALASHPSAGAMRAPLPLLDDDVLGVRRSARLMCGALARAGRGEHPAEAEALEAALLARYERGGDGETRINLISALGNAAGPAVQATLERALADASAGVRASAARALRFSPAEDTNALLASRMSEDPDPAVRAAAIFAAGYRSFDAFAASLAHVATSDRVEDVRAQAVSLLRKENASPKVADTLAWVAQHDEKPGMRRLATEALAAR